MSKILVNEMSFYYEPYYNPVFERVNLILDTDWRLGLTGRNGRGKTTFLKLLEGELEPTQGKLIKSVSMEYYPYHFETAYEKTGDVLKEIIGGFKTMEDVMEAFPEHPDKEEIERCAAVQEKYREEGGYELEARICRELYRMGLPEELLDRDFRVLSGGEKSKLLMLALFLRPNAFVLLDEPTNHLDIRGKQAIAHYLKQKKGFLAVSHDRQFLDETADHILAINKTDITLEKGNYSSWKENTEKKEAFERRTKIRLEKEIKVLEKGAVVRRNWAAAAEKEKNPYPTNNRGNTSRAAKFMHQAKNAEQEAREAIAEKKELLKNYETVPPLYLYKDTDGSGTDKDLPVLQLEKLTFGYDGVPLFHHFSMEIFRGERIWIRGSNGCGKSTLLRLIKGELETKARKAAEEIAISCFYQEPLWQEGSPREWIRDDGQWERFLSLCSRLDIPDEMQKRPLQTYSSGEKRKVDVARALSEESDILLLDEPLNFMDIYFREQLERAILASGPTLVFVEHDERFGSRVATRIIDLDQGAGKTGSVSEDVKEKGSAD